MKLTIKEVLRPLENDTYITSDPLDIARRCANGGEPFRILYDAQTNLYMIGNAWDYTHSELLSYAFRKGWYNSQRDFITEFVGFYNRNSHIDYWCRAIECIVLEEEDELDTSLLNSRVRKDDNMVYAWLYCLGFLPYDSADENYLVKDGYNHKYEYDFGTLFTRDFELSELPDLQRAFSRVS